MHHQLIENLWEESWKEKENNSGRGTVLRTLRTLRVARSRQWWDGIKATNVNMQTRAKEAPYAIHTRQGDNSNAGPPYREGTWDQLAGKHGPVHRPGGMGP